jgi:hypothetical protein
MDGGMNGEVVPVYPLAVKKRGVDVIIAADAVSRVSALSTAFSDR